MFITSILDQDLYSFTVSQAILSLYPNTHVTYKFIDRKPRGDLDAEFLHNLRREINDMRFINLKDDEVEYLKSLPFITSEYVEWLRNFRFDPSQIEIDLLGGNLGLDIRVGDWAKMIFWEVPLLAIISELYFKKYGYPREEHEEQLKEKGRILSGLTFSDFGTRRRRCFDAQDTVVKCLQSVPGFVGTSNVFLAKKYGIKAIGTMSHQWFMGISALESLRHANRYALRSWNQVYKGRLGIALTDTYGTDAFFEDFDGELSRLFDGVRQDSGDPFVFPPKAINHYRKHGIDPLSKVCLFSDNLNPMLCYDLNAIFNPLIKCRFGIGTNLSNNFSDVAALNIVIKLDTCNGVRVIKLSDIPTKATGDKDALRVARWTFYNQPLDQE